MVLEMAVRDQLKNINGASSTYASVIVTGNTYFLRQHQSKGEIGSHYC